MASRHVYLIYFVHLQENSLVAALETPEPLHKTLFTLTPQTVNMAN